MKLVLQALNTSVSKIEMPDKPIMAIALENHKLRDFPEEILNANTMGLVKWLLDLLGVSMKGDNVNHHLACVEFVNKSLGNFTYQEIKLAFEMYVSGKFYEPNGKPMLVTQQLNAVVIGRVMREYDLRKKNELDSYRRKKELMSRQEVTQEEKDLMYLIPLIARFDLYKQNKADLSEVNHIYDDFIQKKIIKPYTAFKNYYNKKYSEARDILINYHTKYVPKDLEDKRVNDGVLIKLKSNTSPLINKKVKDIVVTAYFQSIIDKKTDLREVLKPFYPDHYTCFELLEEATEVQEDKGDFHKISEVFSSVKKMTNKELRDYLLTHDVSNKNYDQKTYEIVERELDKRV